MENSNTNLGSESVGKLLFKLATPAIIAQIVNVLYNIVDRFLLVEWKMEKLLWLVLEWHFQ